MAQMEDTHIIKDKIGEKDSQALFCVFDGHSGKDCALMAAQYFPEEFEKQLPKELNDKEMNQCWKTTYGIIDKKLGSFETEGCTSSTIFVWEYNGKRYIQGANCGDSTAFFRKSSKGSKAIALTVDHKPTLPSERERILQIGEDLPEGAKRIGGLAVSRALGDHYAKSERCGLIGEPEVSTMFELEDNEEYVLVLASDGLWDVCDADQSFDYIDKYPNAKTMSRELIKYALADPNCQDNITVIVAIL